MDERARARGHARLRAHEHGRVVCAHSIFFESRREGVAGHRPRALLVWGVPHQVAFFFYVALPAAVWLVLAEHIIKRGKLVVSGGVTRGRVARGVIGVTTSKDMTSQAQAQKQPKAGPGRESQPGGRPLSVLED